MKNLPIGEQDFRTLRQGNKLYVDKTEQIHDKRYADKFRLNGKLIIGVGVNFNTAKEEKRVDDWVQEMLS